MLSVEITFSEWLQAEINKRGWTWNKLATTAGLSSGTIYNIRDGFRGVGEDSLKAIARALKLPITTVYRAAEFLPQEPEYVPLMDEWNSVFYDLLPDEREELLEIARMKISRRKTPTIKATSRGKVKPARTALIGE